MANATKIVLTPLTDSAIAAESGKSTPATAVSVLVDESSPLQQFACFNPASFSTHCRDETTVLKSPPARNFYLMIS